MAGVYYQKTMEAVLERLNELEVFPNQVEKEADISHDSELVQRVTRDADLLRITDGALYMSLDL